MKILLTAGVVFTPGSQTLDFSGVSGFDLGRLYGVINATAGSKLYAPGIAGFGYQSFANGVLTLQADTSQMAAGDELLVAYESPDAQKVDGSGFTQPVSAVALPLPAGAAKDSSLQAILAAIQAQRVETIWTDDTGTRFIRNDSGGTITWTDVAGNASAAPGTGARPDSDSGTVVSRYTYRATAAGTGFASGDFLDHVVVTDGDAGDLVSNFFRSSAVTLKVEGLYVNLDNNNGRAQAPLVGAAISPVGLVPVYSLSGISRNENAFAVVRAGLTLAVMPKLADYETPMLVETSSSGKITTSGNPYVFRISPPSSLEAETFAPMVGRLGLKKVDFLVLNNDFGRGAATDFGKMLKDKGVAVGLVETMDQGAQDMSAQLAKLKASDSDTIMITSSVDQLVLLFKQMAALGLKKRVITTGGSQNPDQIIAQAGAAADGTMHLTTFLPWSPDRTPDPKATEAFIAAWKKRGFDFAGVTESFRGYDGIRAIAHAIEKAGSADPAAITKAFWSVDFVGLNGPIRFAKAGPAGKESGQSKPDVYLIEIKDGKVIVPAL